MEVRRWEGPSWCRWSGLLAALLVLSSCWGRGGEEGAGPDPSQAPAQAPPTPAIPLPEAVTEAMAGVQGAMWVVDAQTGAVLARGGEFPEEPFPVGSLLQFAQAAVLLDRMLLKPQEAITVDRVGDSSAPVDPCQTAPGGITVLSALSQGCEGAFSRLSARFGLQVWRAIFADLGLDSPPGKAGSVPAKGDREGLMRLGAGVDPGLTATAPALVQAFRAVVGDGEIRRGSREEGDQDPGPTSPRGLPALGDWQAPFLAALRERTPPQFESGHEEFLNNSIWLTSALAVGGADVHLVTWSLVHLPSQGVVGAAVNASTRGGEDAASQRLFKALSRGQASRAPAAQ